MTTPPQPTGTDRGDTLIEVIIAVVIMGLAVTAIMGGVATSVRMSDIQRKQATAGAAVRDYAEAIEKYVAPSPPTNSPYLACATSATYPAFIAPGFTTGATAAQSWNGSAWGPCGTGPGQSPDTGIQLITLTVASSDGRASEKLALILRKPCRPTDSVCT